MAEKREADCRLLHNLYILIEEAEQPRLWALRCQRAENYYEMVLMCGTSAYGKHDVA